MAFWPSARLVVRSIPREGARGALREKVATHLTVKPLLRERAGAGPNPNDVQVDRRWVRPFLGSAAAKPLLSAMPL
jgi:hypothetical protein